MKRLFNKLVQRYVEHLDSNSLSSITFCHEREITANLADINDFRHFYKIMCDSIYDVTEETVQKGE